MKSLEDRLDRVAIRQLVGEVMLSTSLGLVLRSVPDALRRELMRELRANVHVDASAPDSGDVERLVLETEERFERLLDQIEHLSRTK
ncbi:hypothetical protein IVA87_08725 [Bradyrhizobium sp. 147]|uniref:hypothetical protein n=1 Tax=Bradyrhizobium sp. 147 TaxID=2782623 RepID=UPI001FF8A76D|nr:hypothetical protein [Bradyrhizobium sp. 147]MCK1679543.1 hypothetical protein [Bradyrhizobium sp. 147]